VHPGDVLLQDAHKVHDDLKTICCGFKPSGSTFILNFSLFKNGWACTEKNVEEKLVILVLFPCNLVYCLAGVEPYKHTVNI
jgi:hypothetical protein